MVDVEYVRRIAGADPDEDTELLEQMKEKSWRP